MTRLLKFPTLSVWPFLDHSLGKQAAGSDTFRTCRQHSYHPSARFPRNTRSSLGAKARHVSLDRRRRNRNRGASRFSRDLSAFSSSRFYAGPVPTHAVSRGIENCSSERNEPREHTLRRCLLFHAVSRKHTRGCVILQTTVRKGERRHVSVYNRETVH